MTGAALRHSTDDQLELTCSAPGCGHVTELQCALMRIATGGVQRVRVHKRGDDDPPLIELDQWPGLWEELQTTIARLAKMSASASATAHAAESPVPYHARASTVAHRLGNTISTWTRAVAEEYPHLTLTATTIPAAARWLATFPTLLAEHPAAGEMRSGIIQVVMAAERVIDRAPDKVYAGPCLAEVEGAETQCQGQLYATQGKATVRCRDCGAEHDVEVRQEWLSRTLADQLVSAAEAAPVLSWLLGKTITRNNIAAWKRDGRIEVHAGRWPYRFGDLLALAREMKPRKREGSAA